MSFPTSPTNGQQASINGITYTYSSALTAWTVSTAISNSFVSISVAGNVNSGNLLTTGTASVTGNVTGSFFIGNGSALTGIAGGGGASISNGTSNITVVSSGSNVSVGVGGTANVAVFATIGEFITGVLSASGNITGGNLLTGGLISATGNITGGNILGGANVNATTHTGTTVSVSGNITGGNLITSAAVAEAYGGTGTTTGYYGFKNRIINGAMVIDQRNAGAAVTGTASLVYNLDRYASFVNTDGVMTFQQVSDAPTGFKYSLKATATTADASLSAAQRAILLQRIEGYNVIDFMLGSASAVQFTLSFWVKSTLTGTFGGAFQNNSSARAYPFTYTISVANTWEQKTVTITGDTTGTWDTTTGTGLQIVWGLGVGSTYSGTAGTWATGDFNSATGATSVIGTLNATWQVTGVQLEKGSTATSFDYRPYGTELVLCQRYCKVYKSSDSSNGYTRLGYGPAQSTTATVTQCPITTQMRTSPSVTTTGTFIFYDGVTVTDVTSIAVDAAQASYLIFLASTAASGLTATRGYELATKAGGSGVAIFSAEL